MSNHTYTSPWFSPSEFPAFVDQLMPGDIVEFDRGAYKHFGLYADTVEVYEYRGQSNLIINMTDYRKDGREQLCKCIETLESVWADSKARINNSRDGRFPPRSSGRGIVAFAVKKVQEFESVWRRLEDKRREDEACQYRNAEVRKEVRELEDWLGHNNYNLVSNNCEQNATYWRNGKPHSQQVEAISTGAAIVGSLAVLGVAGYLTYKLLSDVGKKKDDEGDEDDEDEDEDRPRDGRSITYSRRYQQ